MATCTFDVAEWAEMNFGACDLGDARRTRRAVAVAQRMAERPDGSTPDQCERWADLKAAYRLFDAEDVTFAALAEPHWRATRRAARGTVLLLGDTTEIDFGLHRQAEGLGPTGNDHGRGFFLHSSLMVEADTREIVGLAGQELFHRRPKPRGENSYGASQRQGRESEVWGRLVDAVGPPAEGVRYLHVFDRGADNLEVFVHLVRQRGDWVIRAAQRRRLVLEETSAGPPAAESAGPESAGPESAPVPLQSVLDRRPRLGTYELDVRPAKDQPARAARLEVRVARVTVPRPKKRLAPYLADTGFQSLTQWVVEAREIDPPARAEPVHWMLWTSLPVESFADARRVIGWYEARWLIEEFHKAIKTGCRLEARQLQTADRLEAVAGMTGVLAVRLVQLKTVAKNAPETPAEHVVPRAWLEMLRALRKTPILTVRDFYRHLAGLGGFLMRKRDGDPGWITLWRGTEKLHLALRGHDAMRKRCG